MLFLWKQIKESFANLGLNKTRAFLTMLGIIIGVSAVIGVTSVGAGAQSLVLDQVKSLGTNLIGVMPGKSEEQGPPVAALGIEITSLKHEDALAMMDLPNIESSYAYIKGRSLVSYENKAEDIDFAGVSAAYPEVEDIELAQGRFFSKEDVNSLARVAILGSEAKENLFGQNMALNERIKIKQVSFKIIGVAKERGTVAFQNQDNQIFIPLKTAQKLLLGVDHVAVIRAKVDNEENIPIAIQQAEELLRRRHNIKDPAKDDFTVRSTAQALNILGTITQSLKVFLAMVAAISLLVGGIGIMNIMLVSVKERTKEIGLRKALGAKKSHILLQFLIESIVLTSFGGILGILLGVLISAGVAFGVGYFGYNWQLIITPGSILTAVVMAWLVGLLFGFWPAKQASKLLPIEALRHE